MCGICGVYTFNEPLTYPFSLKKMADIIRHRGPDDEGFFFNSDNTIAKIKDNFNINANKIKNIKGCGNVGFGHRRLSIIDISGGHQPLSNEDQTVWITYNGEIYNFQELKDSLEVLGHQFKTNSDTEVIVHAYESWGESCVTKLRGMFAFAIWDERKQKLFLARDRVGIKPLYYYNDLQKVVFASEIKAILQYSGIKRELNLESLCDYFKFLYIPAPKTIFKNIAKLLPGHTLTIDKCGIRDQKYWDIEFIDTQYDDSQQHQHANDIIELLKDAIELRMISDVPLGAF